jgi:phosphotriesterase-related protein
MSRAEPQVMTVRGPVSPLTLGPTLIHEHILFDLILYHEEAGRSGETLLPDVPLHLQNLHLVRHNVSSLRDNCVQQDVDVAVEELAQFAALGGGSVVEVTSTGLAPNPVGLLEVAERSGLNVIAGTGYYIGLSHPSELAGRSVESVAEELLRDFVEGFPGTSVRAGVLGEIGTSEPLTPTEEVVLLASARVQRQTGAAMIVHPDSSHRSYQQIGRTLDLLESEGALLHKVIVSHVDERLHVRPDDYARLARRGCVLAFDTFGKQHYYPKRRRQYPNDEGRVQLLARLEREGLAGQIVLSHDICYKSDLTAWGGDGYGHITRNILPRLREAGVSEAAIHLMYTENARWLLPLEP